MNFLGKKVAFVSIHENNVTLSVGSEIFHGISPLSLLDFLKEKKISEVYIVQFFPNFLSIRINLPQIAKPSKKKKVVEALISSEIRKRYFPRGKFTFFYQIFSTEGVHYARAYIVDEESLSIFDHLVSSGIEVKGLYPTFVPVVELLKSRGIKFEGTFAVCLSLETLRHTFVFVGEEMITERVYESDSENLSDLDIDNLNMTINYALQNLRVRPERVVFVGFEAQSVEGLNMQYEFVEVDNIKGEAILCHSTKQFLRKFKSRKFIPSDHQDFISKREMLKVATLALVITSFLFLGLSIEKALKILNRVEKIKLEKAQISSKAQNFQSLVDMVNHFEQKILPILDLQNKRNREVPSRQVLRSLAEASYLKGVQFSSISFLNENPARIMVTGKIIVGSMSERNLIYRELRQTIESRGLKITKEQFDFKVEDFSMEITYEQGKVL